MSKDKEEKQSITLEQFRAWLEGVEEMQEDGWAPDVRQWTKIRERIDRIVSGGGSANLTFPNHPVIPTQPAVFNAPVPAAPSVLEQLTDKPAPAMKMSPNAPIADDPTGKRPVKAPDIDTSDGNYSSAFE